MQKNDLHYHKNRGNELYNVVCSVKRSVIVVRIFRQKGFCIVILALLLCFLLPSCHTIHISTPYSEYAAYVAAKEALESSENAEETGEESISDETEAEIPEVINEPIAFSGGELLGTVPFSVPETEDGITLRISLWETGEHVDLIETAIERYEAEHPGIEIIPEYVDYSGYWGNITADVGGGNLADIIEMDHAHISQFADRGLLSDFTRYISGLYGYSLPIGLKVDVMQYDRNLLEELGIDFPEQFSLDSFVEIGRKIYEKSGLKTATSLSIDLLESISTYRGNNIYNEIRSGETESAEIYFGIVKTVAENPFFTYSEKNTWNIFTDTVNMNPSYGTFSFSEMDFYSLFSVTSSSKHPEAAMDFIVYLISSDDLASLFRFKFGVPVFRDIRNLQLTDDEKLQLDYVFSLGNRISFYPSPAGNSEVARVLSSYSSLVRDGSMTPAEAAAAFTEDSYDILLRAESAV